MLPILFKKTLRKWPDKRLRLKTPICKRDKRWLRSNKKNMKRNRLEECLNSSTSKKLWKMLKRRKKRKKRKRRQKSRRSLRRSRLWSRPQSQKKKSILLKSRNLRNSPSRRWCKVPKRRRHLTWLNSLRKLSHNSSWWSNFQISYAPNIKESSPTLPKPSLKCTRKT